MTKEEIITTVIMGILGSSTLNGVMTHIMYNSKLKKEAKMRQSNMVSDKISEALIAVRDMELELTTIEIYDIEKSLLENGSKVDFFNGLPIYPAIMNDWNSFDEFHNKIKDCRNKHEKFLTCELALNIVFIDRYITTLGTFVAEFGGETSLMILGTIFIFDLQKWQQHFDRLLVKEINKSSYRLESHETKKWKRKRKNILEKQWEETILFYVINGSTSRRHRKKYNMIDLFLSVLIQEMSNEYEQEEIGRQEVQE